MSQTERIFALDRFLRERAPVSAQEVADFFEVSVPSVKLDIQYMRDRLQAPIIYVHSPRRGYVYNPDAATFELPTFWLGPSEIYALVVMRGLLRELAPHWRGGPRERDLDVLLERAEPDATRFARRILILPFEHRPEAPPCFATVAQGLIRERRLKLRYWSRSTDTHSVREVSPLRLLHRRHAWYLFAFCHTKEAPRTFHLDAIDHAEVLQMPADCPLDEAEVDARLSRGFGIFFDSDGAEALLRFSPRRARWVQDQLWHPDQELRPREDGSLELRIPYGDATELIMEILRHGEEVEVLDPPELRSEVEKRLRAALDLYVSAAPR